MRQKLFYYSKQILSFSLAYLISVATFSQTIKTNKTPAKTATIAGINHEILDNTIYYPAPADIKYLKRAHYAYNQNLHIYDKDYIKHKYYVSFSIPHQTIKYVSFSMPPKAGPDGKMGKPTFFTEWFSPRLLLVNMATGAKKQLPISHAALRGVLNFNMGALIDGMGTYEIRIRQSFPLESEFRQQMISIYRNDSDEGDTQQWQQKRKDDIDKLVNDYKEMLGKSTEIPIYRYSANYDFLVAAIGDSYSSGEGNPMVCGKDIPEYGIFDPFVEIYRDTKNAAENLSNDLMDGNFMDAYKDYLTISTFMPEIEQIAGPCTITTLNLAGMTAPNFDIKPVWIENGLDNEQSKVSRSYINPTAPATFSIEDKYKGIAVTYLNFASSGATSEHLYYKNQHAFQKVSQIEELAKNLENTGNRQIDALTISIGANDIGFSSIMGSIVGGEARALLNKIPLPAIAIALAIKSGASKDDIRRKIVEDITKLDEKFEFLDFKIKQKLKVKKVFLLEYPNAQFTYSDNGVIKIGSGCGVLNLGPINFTKEDAEIISDAGTQLNNKLRSLAQKHGWVFVSGATNAFAGHGYCTDPNTSYYRAAETSCGCQGNYQGILHPNSKGFSMIKPLVLASFESNFPFNQYKNMPTVDPSSNSTKN